MDLVKGEWFDLYEMRNEDVYWVLVGDGNKRSEFETYAKTNRLEKAVFVGLRNDIPSILDESDLFILPSILEGLGTVVLEAQARGKKCIISENVTNEVDMKLGLVKKVMLSNVNAWKQEILSNHIVDLSLDEIKNTFVDRKVEISACAEYLLSLYR